MSKPASRRGGNDSIRAATPADADDLAHLIDEAGEGIPRWLWSRAAAPGESPFDVGRRRALRTEGSFSYRNAHVTEAGGRVAGLLLGYRLPDPYPEYDPDELPAVVRPLIELEREAPGTWYLNAIAVYPSHRGRGHGKRLLHFAESLARSSGAEEISLIVAEANDTARGLYLRAGYRIRGRRPIAPIPELQRGGDWVLMTKALP